MARQAGLGRGLGALIQDRPAAKGRSEGGTMQVPVADIRPNPWQPRQTFDPDAFHELVQSVRDRGVMQPLLVRAHEGHYELIAGERRFRAAREAELAAVPVILVEATDQEALELALIENLQREDLSIIEEAEGYRQLADHFKLTQSQIAERVGKARATVANAMRLLDLSESIRTWVAEGRLSPGHAKVLLQVETPHERERLAERVIREQASVRALEKWIETAPKKQEKRKRPAKTDIPPDHLRTLTDAMHRQFGTSVRIQPCRTVANGKKVKGVIEIDFYSSDELDRLLEVLGIAGNL